MALIVWHLGSQMAKYMYRHNIESSCCLTSNNFPSSNLWIADPMRPEAPTISPRHSLVISAALRLSTEDFSVHAVSPGFQNFEQAALKASRAKRCCERQQGGT